MFTNNVVVLHVVVVVPIVELSQEYTEVQTNYIRSQLAGCIRVQLAGYAGHWVQLTGQIKFQLARHKLYFILLS